jgi:hypothetical protein
MYRIMLSRAAAGVARLCPAACLRPDHATKKLGGASCLPTFKRYNDCQNVAYSPVA